MPNYNSLQLGIFSFHTRDVSWNRKTQSIWYTNEFVTSKLLYNCYVSTERWKVDVNCFTYFTSIFNQIIGNCEHVLDRQTLHIIREGILTHECFYFLSISINFKITIAIQFLVPKTPALSDYCHLQFGVANKFLIHWTWINYVW